MSREVSSSTGKAYGVQRVCRVAGVPRSSYYAREAREAHPCPQHKRGPKPAVSDAVLLEAIREALAASPF